MAFVFNSKPVATIKAKDATSTDMYTIYGCTTATTTPVNAATQINKILDIGGLEIAADEYMSRTITEEVVDNE